MAINSYIYKIKIKKRVEPCLAHAKHGSARAGTAVPIALATPARARPEPGTQAVLGMCKAGRATP